MKLIRVKGIIAMISISLCLITKSVFSQDPNYQIYLCFGQSNMAGAGPIETQDLTVDSRFQFMKPQDCSSTNQFAGNWYPGIPPLWGCSGGLSPADYFGRTMVANLPTTVKVGVVNVAIPGCDIALFFKTGYAGYDTYNYVPTKYAGSAYAWLLDLAKQAQKVGVIKGILLHQGESNNGQATWPAQVKTVYNNLITDLGLDASKTPLLVGELLYQNQGGTCWGHNSVIAKVPSVIPNSYVISADGLPGKDQFHFNSAGNRTFGVRYAQQMLKLLAINTFPTVSLTSSVSSALAPASITLSATAADSDGSITKVEFYNGSTKLGEDVSAPYSYNWTNIIAGSYSITAIATDNSGNKTTSTAVSIKVNPVQAAYGGTPSPIPGTIQFENYDIGGNGFAYLDNATGNTGGATFRTDEDVDIENCTDVGAGYSIGFSTKGEWMEYTVNVAKAGKYNITLRVACNGDGRKIVLKAKDIALADSIVIPNTAGWQTWTDVKVNNVNFDAGIQVIRVIIGATDYVNLNYMTYSTVVTPVSLVAGWNYVGYPLKSSTDVSNALSSIWSNVLTIKNSESFYEKSQPATFNSLMKLDWGQGYLIKVSAACSLDWSVQ